jgi:glycerate kinase
MKIVIAPQAFKGCASAHTIASTIAAGVHRALPNASIILTPVADGGDGTLDILLSAKSGERYLTTAVNANNNPKMVFWGALTNTFPKTAIIESARVCGLAALKKKDQNPLKTTTFGIGSLMNTILSKDYSRLFIGLGGTATNDAGAGLAKALGVQFLDKENKELPFGGAALINLKHIDITHLNPLIHDSEIIAGCDVINPLLGPNGASLVYSPQKNASKLTTALLEDALGNFAFIVKQDLGIDISTLPYLGSAGGIAAALYLFCHAKLVSGAEWIMQVIGFDKMLENADLVITGEGRLDFQTASLKAPLAVAMAAKKQKISVIAIAGCLEKGTEALQRKWFDACFAVSSNSIVQKNALQLLEKTSEQAIRKIGF